MKKKLGFIKLKIISGKANPSPPIGPALGQKGINIIDFCKKFNNETKHIDNLLLSVKIYFYSDKTFNFIYKNSTVNFLVKDYIKNYNSLIENKNYINYNDLLNIVKYKLNDLNTNNFYSGLKIIYGCLKSMGIFIKN